MKSNHLAHQGIWVVTIHDKEPERQLLAFDTKEVLLCLGSSIHNFVWIIADLDCTGGEAQSLCDAVEESRRSGTALVVSWNELIAASQKFDQTLDGTILGIPQNADIAKLSTVISDFSLFPRSPVALVIRAVDSSYFEVITKNYHHVELLKKCFRDVREEDSNSYFVASAIR
jgi:hypothetical protein